MTINPVSMVMQFLNTRHGPENRLRRSFLIATSRRPQSAL